MLLVTATCRGAPGGAGTDGRGEPPGVAASQGEVTPDTGVARELPQRGSAAIPVIPGAEGPGMGTPAGRGGAVVRVTTLADGGPGSLRAALDRRGPRTIVFDVGGTIALRDNLSIAHPFVTLAGQTAPAPGITLRGATLMIRTHDVLVQHVRIRVGDDPAGPPPAVRDGIRVRGDSQVGGIVIDHVSVSWAIDELFSIYDSRGVTVRHSIFAHALHRSRHPEGPHSKGMLLAEGAHDVALIGNLLAHNVDRNPAIKGNTSVTITGNVVYNWGNGKAIPVWDSRSGPTGLPTLAAVQGNVFIAGPDTPRRARALGVDSSVAPGSRVYLADNAWEGALAAGPDPWSIAEVDPLDFPVRTTTAPVWLPARPRPSAEVEAWVLAQVGARPAERDHVDLQIVRDVRARGGRVIDRPDDAGDGPEAASTRHPLTLPDRPSADDDGDGYTNLEEWLHARAAAVESIPR